MQDRAIPGLVAIWLGIVLLAVPWVMLTRLQNPVAAITEGLVGIAVIALGCARVKYPDATWASAGILVLGLWLAVTPWVLGYSHTDIARWTDTILGSLLAIDALWQLVAA